jgi:uncharacterized membrane protein
MASIIEFLFGHKIHDWARGVFSFQAPLGYLQIMGAVAVLILVVLFFYRRTTARATPRLKTVLILLKSAALTILFLCLLQPIVTTSSVRPQESTIGLLIDNSRSMTIQDMERSRSRGEVATDILYGNDGLVDQLRKNFTVGIFGFDRNTRPVSGPDDLSFSGSRTYIAEGIQHVGDAMKGLSLGALVLITDGADNGSGDALRNAGILNNRNIPVYVIGIGANRDFNDLEINRIDTSESFMQGGIFEVQVTVISRGYEGRESDLLIEAGERVVASKKIKHGPDGRPRRYSLQLSPEKEGILVYTVRIPEQEDEIIKKNNRLSFLLDNQAKRAEILYVEGHPRNEYKFIRRAAGSDKALHLKTYLKTGPHKFLRQDIESTMELAQGYPASEEELFEYDAVIFGDIPRNFFTDDQLALTREFVSKRGGGFLMIGGTTAFDEGFIGTPIEDLLPVALVNEKYLPPDLHGGGRKGDHPTGRKFTLQLTAEGERSTLLRLGVEDEANRKLWRDMPQLQGVNVTGRAKPGATVLAVHPTLRFQGNLLPIMAYERYGRGRTMAITTATTWRWQMLRPYEDTSHEKLWRQILRWLTTDTPARVEIELERSRFSSGDDVKVRARVHDQRFEPVDNATVWLKITDPGEAIQDLRMGGNIAQPGEYGAAFSALKPGVYQLEVSSSGDSRQTGYASTSFLVADSLHEFRDAVLNSEPLQKIARTSGGKYYTHRTADRLVKDLQNNRQTQTVNVQLDVWDMPLVFLFLLTFFGLEWMLRRRKGLS